MPRVHAVIAGISLWMARAGGALLIIASAVITFEIVARKFFLLPFNVGTEVSTYALAVGASWSFAYTLLHRAHVRIDVLRNWLPLVARAFLDVAALLSLTAVAVILAWYLFDTVEASWTLGARENTSLGTPLVLPHGLWFIGLLWFAVVCVEQLVTVLGSVLRGDADGVIAKAGPSGVEEELKEVLTTVETPRQETV
jgi:TRAP-type mannitol/chloroaromatic compound transport system permease small subunit